MSPSQKTRYFKTGTILFFIVCIFYWFSPAGVSIQRESVKGTKGSVQLGSEAIHGTTKCTKSYSRDKPIVQYVLMVDAGSTGSRIHVYKFNNCGPTPELEKEEFLMNEKSIGGLSAYEHDPVAAAKTLDPLLAVAMKEVPDKLKGCTPIAVKATAGLRKIGKEKADAILAQVRTYLETAYPFPVVSAEKGGVQIMDGSDEGVYAWITTNYLLGNIGTSEKTETAAIFDLGGGSTQIVFEPTFKSVGGAVPEKLAENENKFSLAFGGRKFELYQHSHLNYGLMAAREAIHDKFVSDLAKSHEGSAWMEKPIVHPCIAPGMSKKVNVTISDKKHEVQFDGPKEPAPAQCRNLAEQYFDKAKCSHNSCSFNNVYQPLLTKTFANAPVYIFSFFYDRTKILGMPDSFTLRELHDLAQTVCKGKSAWGVFSGFKGAIAELEDRADHCLDLSFMMALLHTGYDMPIDREVRIAKKIKDNELGWCLGASLPLLEADSGWKCKA